MSLDGFVSDSCRYLERPEGRIAYDVEGDGPLVLLVPGMGELRSSYRYLVPQLVDAGHRVASADLRGHGQSDATFSAYGDVATATDVQALIEELGGSAVVVGNSLAAGSAVLVAAEHPELVTGLVLVGPFVRNPPQSAADAQTFQALTAPDGVADRWRDFMPVLYAGRKPDDFEAYRDAVRAGLSRPAYGLAFSETTRGADHAPAEARIHDVTAPVLVLMGALDPDFADPAGEAAWIAEATRGSVVMVADSGHYPQAQQPRASGAAVVDFLRRALPRA